MSWPLWRTDRKAAHTIRVRDLVTVYAVFAVLPIAALIITGWARRTSTLLDTVTTSAPDGRDPFVSLVSITAFLMAPGLVFFYSFLLLGRGGVLAAAGLGGFFAAFYCLDVEMRGQGMMVSSASLTIVLGALIGALAWFFLAWLRPEAFRRTDG